MNLQCSLVQAGEQQPVMNSEGQESGQTLDCGDDRIIDTIPYVVLLLLMIGTTFYQQRQMQQASPPGAQSSQQQAILKYMPLMFAFFGLQFPAGLVLYWTTSNLFQIGQQAFLLRAGHIGPEALERRMAEQRARSDAGEPAKKGFMARMMERAEQAQQPPTGGGASGSQGQPKGSRSGATSGRPPKRKGGGSGGRGSGKRG
jgi:YidC/Oxa1 family membrane protein insertase